MLWKSENFEEKLKNIKHNTHNLKIISDFDRTLTENKNQGSMISLLRERNYLNENYSKKAKQLYNYYHTIEVNPELDKKYKEEKMKEWWLKHYELLKEHKLNKKHIDEALNNSNFKLKKGVKRFLEWTNKNNIPLLIFSSNGLGYSAIEYFLKKQNILLNNIYIISNKLKYDEKGNFVDVEKPIIHSFNKKYEVIKQIPKIYDIVKDKKYTILFGDNESDSYMVPSDNNTLKICLLGKNNKENLEHYKKLYDLIYVTNSDFEEINNILF